MSASTALDLWLYYQHSMDLHCQAEDPHTRNLMLADAIAGLDLWFGAIERELNARLAVERHGASRTEATPT